MAQVQLPVSGEVRSAHVDWLTATAREDTARTWFEAHAPAALGAEAEAGNTPRPFHWQEYRGWTCGQCSYGRRPDGDLIRLTGSGAAHRWRDWAQIADNVSRLDLAVTVWLPDADQALALAHYASATDASRKRGAALQTSVIVNSDGGATTYLGSRSSDKFGRCYDKGLESEQPEYAGCWRYEVEIKGRPALTSARWLLKQADEGNALARSVWTYWHDRGATPRFTVPRRLLLPPTVIQPSDDQKRLAWLHDQVSVTVARLVSTQGRATVLQALGLMDPGAERLS